MNPVSKKCTAKQSYSEAGISADIVIVVIALNTFFILIYAAP